MLIPLVEYEERLRYAPYPAMLEMHLPHRAPKPRHYPSVITTITRNQKPDTEGSGYQESNWLITLQLYSSLCFLAVVFNPVFITPAVGCLSVGNPGLTTEM